MNKTAFITGANKGIGFGISNILASQAGTLLSELAMKQELWMQ